MVIPRAMVRDLAEGHAAAVLLSRLSLVMGAAPILAPTVGSAVLAFADWRGIFWILTAYGATCWVLVVLLLPDTLPEGRRIRLRLGEQFHRYRSILNERGFITHATMGGFATFAFFAYLGGSSPVFIQGFGLSPARYAMIFGVNSFGLICCAQLSPHLLRRFGHSHVLRGAARVHLAATGALAVIAFAGWHTLALIVAPVFVAISCMGILNPNTIVGALARHQQHAGSASSVMGREVSARRGQRTRGRPRDRRHAARHGGADAGGLHRSRNRRRMQTACIASLVPLRIDWPMLCPPLIGMTLDMRLWRITGFIALVGLVGCRGPRPEKGASCSAAPQPPTAATLPFVEGPAAGSAPSCRSGSQPRGPRATRRWNSTSATTSSFAICWT